MGALLALLALLGIMDGVEPLMVWVSGFPFLCLPLCLASSHIPNPCTSHSATPLLLGCDFFVFFFSFLSYDMACGISVPQRGIKPGPLAVEAES